MPERCLSVLALRRNCCSDEGYDELADAARNALAQPGGADPAEVYRLVTGAMRRDGLDHFEPCIDGVLLPSESRARGLGVKGGPSRACALEGLGPAGLLEAGAMSRHDSFAAPSLQPEPARGAALPAPDCPLSPAVSRDRGPGCIAA